MTGFIKVTEIATINKVYCSDSKIFSKLQKVQNSYEMKHELTLYIKHFKIFLRRCNQIFLKKTYDTVCCINKMIIFFILNAK